MLVKWYGQTPLQWQKISCYIHSFCSVVLKKCKNYVFFLGWRLQGCWPITWSGAGKPLHCIGARFLFPTFILTSMIWSWLDKRSYFFFAMVCLKWEAYMDSTTWARTKPIDFICDHFPLSGSARLFFSMVGWLIIWSPFAVVSLAAPLSGFLSPTSLREQSADNVGGQTLVGSQN